jgi:PKD repeat protein
VVILLLLCSYKVGYTREEDTSSNYLCEYGIKLYQKGDIQGAIHEFKKALQINPHNEEAREYLRRISLKEKLPPLSIPATINKKKNAKLGISSPGKICINEATTFYGQVTDDNDFIYEWKFGDDTVEVGREVIKTYTKAGTYKVSLAEYDNSPVRHRRAYATKLINVYSPPVAEAGQDITACVGEDLILDGTQSYTTNSIERCLNCNLLTYIWDFGDGSPKVKGARVKHIYRNPDTYKATLKVIDGKARKCSDSQDSTIVTIYAHPDITIRKIAPACPARQINFAAFRIATSLEKIDRKHLKYTWDFGDGTVEEGKADISHTYRKAGEYLVKVTADDQHGTRCSQSNDTLKVRINNPPEANAGPNLVCCTNVISVFDGSGSVDLDKDPLSYSWDFGDGSTGKGVKTTHVYTKKGDYKVTLKVDDNSGTPCSSSTDSFIATVHERPVSIINYKNAL